VLEDYVTVEYGPTKPNGQLFDFATIIPRGECENKFGSRNARCAGLLYEDCHGETDEVSDHQPPQDAWFPGSVSMHGFRLDVSKATASYESDEVNIRRLLAGTEDKINNSLRKRFAPSAAYMAVTELKVEGVSNGDASLKVLKEIMESGLLGDNKDMTEALDEQACVADCSGYCYSQEHTRCLIHLLEAKCCPNVAGIDGTGLRQAVRADNWDVVRILLQHNADPWFRPPNGHDYLREKDIETIPNDVAQQFRKSGFGENANWTETVAKDKHWNELSQQEKDAAVICGHTASSWDDDEDTAIDEKDWSQLNGEQRGAAQLLGYNQQTWDDDSDSD